MQAQFKSRVQEYRYLRSLKYSSSSIAFVGQLFSEVVPVDCYRLISLSFLCVIQAFKTWEKHQVQ